MRLVWPGVLAACRDAGGYETYQTMFIWGFSSSPVNILLKLVSLLQGEWFNGDDYLLFRSSSPRLSMSRKTQLPRDGKSTGFYQLLAENSEIQPVSAGVINGKDNLFQNLSSKIYSGFFPAKFHNRISDWNPILISAYNLCHLVAGKSLFLKHI